MKQIIKLKEPVGKINDSSDMFKKIQKINIDHTQENFIVFYLNSGNRIIKHEILFKGGLNTIFIDGKTLFRKALLNNANSIIISHNHPSGNLTPSDEDIQSHKDLKKIGSIIGINVLDSVIFNQDSFYSFHTEKIED